MMKQEISKSVFVLILLIVISCMGNVQKNKSNQEAEEDFYDFYDKFYQDSSFQITRVKFPLSVYSTDDVDLLDPESGYSFLDKEDWVFFQKPDEEIFDVNIIKTDSSIIEKITSEEYLGMIVISHYKLIENNWYLVRFEDINN